MKRGYRYILLGAWLVVMTGMLALWWLEHPDTYPSFPDRFWEWLGQLYGAACCDEQADLELLLRLSLSFVVVSFLTFFALFFWRRIKRR